MYRKSKKLLAWSLVVCMIVTQMLFSSVALAADKANLATDRFAGADRYATAIEVSKAGWTTSDYAVLAYGEGFADALAAAPLAKKLGAPILLTGKDALSAGVLDELQRLGVKEVYIVGGEGVVSKAVEDAILAAGMDTTRLWGTDRYMTALAVAQEMGTPDTVVLAYGENYADALSVSAIAAAKGWPILLTGTNAIDADVKAYIGDKKVYVVGGAGVVSDAVLNQFAGAVRLGGVDRYDTNLKVLEQFAADLNFLNVFVATGEGFADALAGSVLAAMYESPLVLVANSVAPATLTFLGGKVTSESAVFAFGGTAVVPDSVLAAIAPSTPTPGVLGVESVTTLGLNGIRVKFTQEVDKDSATTDLANKYQLDGVNLSNNDTATLASDNKTLTIILDAPHSSQQYKKKLFTIKDKVVLSKDTLTSIPKYEKELTFSDTAVPTVESVKVSGNKKLTVTFSEPVKLAAGRVGGPVYSLTGYGTMFKIDGNYLTSYGFKDATTTVLTNNGYGIKFDLNFDVAIPAGAHTLKTLKGNSLLFDYANYFVPETDTSFTVESVTTAPQVVSVVGQTNGTVEITFDRAMDTNPNNVAVGRFGINGDANGTGVSSVEIKSNTDDKVIKVKALNNTLNEGANVIAIDNELKDAWGNKLHADTDQRYSFTVSKDTVKPTVVSVVMIASDKIRVKFSEDVDRTFATTISNYTLKDSSGVTKNVISRIDPEPATSWDTYTITLTEALTGENYTLKIKNIVDLANPVNTMDEYVATFNGIDDKAPQVAGIDSNSDGIIDTPQVVKVNGSKVAVYFTEAMDPATVTDPANYAYVDTNASPNTRSLPSSAVITMGDTGKFVTIEFPSGYSVWTTGNAAGEAGYGASNYYVQNIRVSNVKDVAGNVLRNISVIADIVLASSTNVGSPKYSANTFKLIKDSTSTRAEIEFDQVLTTFNPSDFYIAGTSGLTAYNATTCVKASSGYVSGKKVVLNFENDATDPDRRETLMSFGKDAYLYTEDTVTSANQSGVLLATFEGANAVQVWDDQIKPELVKFNGNFYVDVVPDNTVVAGPTAYGYTNNTGTTVVVLKFTEDIDATIAGLYNDDFTFTQDGKVLEVASVSVGIGGDNSYLIYQFKATTQPTHDTSKRLTVRAKSTVEIRDLKDSGAGDYNTYAPKTDDLNGRYWN